MNEGRLQEIANDCWNLHLEFKDKIEKKNWGTIILLFVFLTRLDVLLESTKNKVLEEHKKIKNQNPDLVEKKLNKISGLPFYNTSKYNFDSLIIEHKALLINIRNYIFRYPKELQDIFNNFKIDSIIKILHNEEKLLDTLQYFKKMDSKKEAGLDRILKSLNEDEMANVYEKIIVKSNESINEAADKHFTPRDIVKLMCTLLFKPDTEILKDEGLVKTVYDSAAGTGGMLAISKDYLKSINKEITVDTFGQEQYPESYAICKSYMLIKGLKFKNIKSNNSLTITDGFKNDKFHYLISNPPFGDNWSKYRGLIEKERDKGSSGKFGGGIPAVTDGQMLFLQQMISKMQPKESGGSRIIMVTNGSPLFSDEAGHGENSIRKWIIENDYLETIIGLPSGIFYKSDITTYLWILSNNKSKDREGKIQLIDARSKDFCKLMSTNVGKKRNIISNENIDNISKIYQNFEDNKISKIFNKFDFGYVRITINRPKRYNFKINEERIKILKNNTKFLKFSEIKTKAKHPTQKEILSVLTSLPKKSYDNFKEFHNDLSKIFKEKELIFYKNIENSFIESLSTNDSTAKEFFRSETDLKPEYDIELEDHENISLPNNILLNEKINNYFKEKVLPYVPDARIDNTTKCNIGYEIPFHKLFYKFSSLKNKSEINKEIKNIRQEIYDNLDELI